MRVDDVMMGQKTSLILQEKTRGNGRSGDKAKEKTPPPSKDARREPLSDYWGGVSGDHDHIVSLCPAHPVNDDLGSYIGSYEKCTPSPS